MTNLFFLVIGCLVTASIFKKAVRGLLIARIPVWVPLLIAGFFAVLIGVFFRIVRRILQWRPLGLSFLALVVLSAGVYWITRPDTNTFSVIDAVLAFPIDTTEKDEFSRRSMFLLRLNDARNLNKEFPDLFKEPSAAILDELISQYTTAIEKLFDSFVLKAHLRIELAAHLAPVIPFVVARIGVGLVILQLEELASFYGLLNLYLIPLEEGLS